MNGGKKKIRKQENKNLSKHIIIKKRFINKKNVNLQIQESILGTSVYGKIESVRQIKV